MIEHAGLRFLKQWNDLERPAPKTAIARRNRRGPNAGAERQDAKVILAGPHGFGLEYRSNRWIVDRCSAINAEIAVARRTGNIRWREIGFGGARRARRVLKREIVGWILPGLPGFEEHRCWSYQINCRHDQFRLGDAVEHCAAEGLIKEPFQRCSIIFRPK